MKRLETEDELGNVTNSLSEDCDSEELVPFHWLALTVNSLVHISGSSHEPVHTMTKSKEGSFAEDGGTGEMINISYLYTLLDLIDYILVVVMHARNGSPRINVFTGIV